MQINGKNYKINADIEFGLFEDLQNNPEDMEVLKKVLKEILIPAPSDEELRKFKMSQIMKAMAAFGQAQEDLTVDFKKKRSH